MNKSDELKEFVVVLLVSICIASLFVIALTNTGQPPEPEQTFKVVNQYNDCDVVRYTDPYNRYHYFFDCQ